jgi:hypothetical protein
VENEQGFLWTCGVFEKLRVVELNVVPTHLDIGYCSIWVNRFTSLLNQPNVELVLKPTFGYVRSRPLMTFINFLDTIEV